MTLFFKKKLAVSSASSMASAGLATSQNATTGKNPCLFSKFDEKKDYVRRCSLKTPAARKTAPCSVSLCLGKKL
ncbi:hypothetical protein HF325_003453 [Metschnikowia pulcherrima]|uniref:Uncharacterized protein n=1 Tax=Metschnikowia pulcherrima TaxID=27326 RepID=A0A8H7LC69_9ASCO|nr:hypothetical protein HF325_003453 [Metschnikowia pulcherrima]